MTEEIEFILDSIPGSATIKVTGTNGTFSVPFRVPALLTSC